MFELTGRFQSIRFYSNILVYTLFKLIAQLGDCHLYLNHKDAAMTYVYRNTDNIELPKLKIHGNGIVFKGGHRSNPGLEIPKKKNFELINYNPLPAIPAKLNVGE